MTPLNPDQTNEPDLMAALEDSLKVWTAYSVERRPITITVSRKTGCTHIQIGDEVLALNSGHVEQLVNGLLNAVGDEVGDAMLAHRARRKVAR